MNGPTAEDLKRDLAADLEQIESPTGHLCFALAGMAGIRRALAAEALLRRLVEAEKTVGVVPYSFLGGEVAAVVREARRLLGG